MDFISLTFDVTFLPMRFRLSQEKLKWCTQLESNQQPTASKTGTLSNWAMGAYIKARRFYSSLIFWQYFYCISPKSCYIRDILISTFSKYESFSCHDSLYDIFRFSSIPSWKWCLLSKYLLARRCRTKTRRCRMWYWCRNSTGICREILKLWVSSTMWS